MQNKTDLYAYSFHKLLHTKDILLHCCKMLMKFRKKKSARLLKKNLKVNLYTMYKKLK